MTALTTTPTDNSSANFACEYRDPPRPLVRMYVPIAAALTIALTSFVTLAAYDEPLDRQALTPSVMEFIEVSSDAGAGPIKAQVPSQIEGNNAHAMLLRYEFTPGSENLTSWHPGEFTAPEARVQPFLL